MRSPAPTRVSMEGAPGPATYPLSVTLQPTADDESARTWHLPDTQASTNDSPRLNGHWGQGVLSTLLPMPARPHTDVPTSPSLPGVDWTLPGPPNFRLYLLLIGRTSKSLPDHKQDFPKHRNYSAWWLRCQQRPTHSRTKAEHSERMRTVRDRVT